ncbi:MAG: hypothetical protein K2P26_01010, partial [Oscillospiraceae bacterium]|nr:hypothetical protein [Oscillospiraceae bacterium]
CLYCWLILFCQSLQTILRIILDTTQNQGMDFVVVLGGRQPARALRLATPRFPSPPFYRFSPHRLYL